ncbi:tetratricopeptide repeat protein [Streptomyces sp. NPDC018693]|uniref:tetratricopeptide repeat protein n=1 Tax=unclassified Streptomyces TaxID=2593676 RepID=UPI0037B56318
MRNLAVPPPPLLLDDALDDAELRAARTAQAQGRRRAARSLLARTGDDWDRRGHRITVLAADPYAVPWARDWLRADPGSADASVLLGLALVHRVLRGRDDPEQARAACREAVERAPADPTPWLGLLMLEGDGGPAAIRLFEEVRARCPDHHQAHHLLVARLAERRGDTGPDPLHEVYEFAAWAAERAPADSPLAILPVVAHAERYRVLATHGFAPADPATSGHWSDGRAREVLKAAFDWWLEWEHDGHPRRLLDLNFLAHAKVCEGRSAEAAALFQRIGDHATAVPWAYPDRDPRAAFRAARAGALGSDAVTLSRTP